MKIKSTKCYFHELKEGDFFSNYDEEQYNDLMEKEHAVGVFVRTGKPDPTDNEPNGYQKRNAVVNKLTITKPRKKKA